MSTTMTFAPGAPIASIDAVAGPAFASLDREGAPVVVADCDTFAVLAMNVSAAALFGGTMDSVARRLFQGSALGPQRLTALARSLLPDAAPRLERMRFFVGPATESMTLLCRRVSSEEGRTLLVVAAPGMRAAAKPEATPRLAVVRAPVRPADEQARPANEATSAPAIVAAQAASSLPVKRHRFVWRTDRDGRLTEATPAFATRLRSPVHVTGRPFAHILAEVGADASGRFVAALTARETFSGLVVDWPLADAQDVAPRASGGVEFGAVPSFSAGQFSGFRGYAIVTEAAPPADGSATVSEGVRQETIFSAARNARPVEVAPSDVVTGDGAPSGVVTGNGAPSDVVTGNGALDEVAPSDVAPSDVAPSDVAPSDDRPNNVVPLRPLAAAPETATTDTTTPEGVGKILSTDERSAFDEIARTLSASLFTPASLLTPASLSPTILSPTILSPTSLLTPASSVTAESVATADDPAAAEVSTSLPAENSPAQETPAQNLPAENSPAQDNMRKIVDLVPIGILVSRGGVAIFANRTLLDLAGYSDVDALHNAGGLDRLLGGVGVDKPGEAAVAIGLVDSAGETTPVDARMHAIAWEGLPATLISMRRAVDHNAVARAKSLEQDVRVRDNEARELHAILDTATDGIVVFGQDRAILSLNRSGEALFGCEAADVKGRPLESLVVEESRAPLAEYLAGVAGGGVESVLNDGREILCQGPRGGLIPVFITIGRLGTQDLPRFCAVLRDLSAWKNAEQGLNQARSDAEIASAQKSEFLARISHEIRTPLNAILGFAEVIMDERFGPVGNERYRDYMKDIHRSGEHVMSLVNDLLDLSKIEAGKMDMNFAAVDGNSIVSDCVALMQPQASRARVVIRLSLAPRLPKVIADDRALRQIVLNLLSNAVKYNDTGGQVIVSTARTDAGHAVVRIRDTGLGMSDAELQVALEPFGQNDTSRTTTGTGLGLPLTKALVEANRASFSMKSRKGEGTLVEVAFPPSRVIAE